MKLWIKLTKLKYLTKLQSSIYKDLHSIMNQAFSMIILMTKVCNLSLSEEHFYGKHIYRNKQKHKKKNFQ